MRIEQSSLYNNRYSTVKFGAASDITVEYALKKHSKFLPPSMINRIQELITQGKGNSNLLEIHNETYKDLFSAKSLEDVKNKFSEFSDIKDINSLIGNRSIALKAVQKLMPLKDFTLFYLKKLYKPTPQDKLVSELGFSNRSLLSWLNKKLNIKKLNGSYLQLLKMSDEKENKRIADLSRKAIYANTEAQNLRLRKAAETHRTPEYRAKKRQEMKNYYERNPQTSKRTGLISKLTWNKCPEIKTALSEYTKNLSPYIRKILSKKQSGVKLTQEERRITYGYYKNFWEQNPQYKTMYRQRRIETIEELKQSGF